MKSIENWKRYIYFYLIYILPSLAFAHSDANPPPPPNFEDSSISSGFSPFTEIILGNLTIELERTTLNEVLQAAHAGKIEHEGDAGNSRYWVCFTAPTGRLWLLSSELGGKDHVVDGVYTVENSPPWRASASCPELPLYLSHFSLNNFLYMGMNLDDIRSQFSRPSKKANGWWLYSYIGKTSSGYEEATNFSFRVAKGKVTGIFLSKSTTN
jgi:hypothetical protein